MKWWKLKREGNRLREQILSVPAFLLEYSRQKKYDQLFSQKVKIFDGIDLNSELYAIVLSYQVNGLSKASLFTCQHLHNKGYRVFLVSNTALSEQDLHALSTVTWKIMLRPNFGYDFGGYRDGVLWLKQLGIIPKRLLLLNDSTWYPLYSDDVLLDRIALSEADFIGALQLHKIRRHDQIVFESYFYSFSEKLYQSAIFTQFWQKYLLSDIKYRAVKAGERKLSRVLLKAEKNSEGVFKNSEFLALIQKQDHLFLFKTLTYAAYIDDAFMAQNTTLLETYNDSVAWCESARAHITTVSLRRHFHASFCYATIKLMGIPFLKKSFTPLHISMRKQYCRAVLNGDLPAPSCPEMHEEICSRDS